MANILMKNILKIQPFLTKEFIKKYGNKSHILQDDNFVNEIKKEVPQKKRR